MSPLKHWGQEEVLYSFVAPYYTSQLPLHSSPNSEKNDSTLHFNRYLGCHSLQDAMGKTFLIPIHLFLKIL